MMNEKMAMFILEEHNLLIKGKTVEPANSTNQGSFDITLKKREGGFLYYDLRIMNADGSPRVPFTFDVPIGVDNLMGFIDNSFKEGIDLCIIDKK